MPEQDRRDALKIIGTIGATCAFPFSADELYGQHEGHSASGAGQAALGPPKVFNAEEMQVLARLTDLIIPPTDTPGAAAAGVPRYIDLVAEKNDRLRKIVRDGLTWLETKGFSKLPETGQIALLTPLCDAADKINESTLNRKLGKRGLPPEPKPTPDAPTEVQFFLTVKNLTADGYFTARAGLVETLGYKGNTVRGEYPACEG